MRRQASDLVPQNILARRWLFTRQGDEVARTQSGLKGRHSWVPIPFLLLILLTVRYLLLQASISFSVRRRITTGPTSYEMR